MTDILRKFSRAELRRLNPGDWVAWTRSNWDSAAKQDFAFWEAQVVAHPVRSAQHVLILFNGHPLAVPKNRLYKVMPIIGVEEMHTEVRQQFLKPRKHVYNLL
jgi:hypothetical protein